MKYYNKLIGYAIDFDLYESEPLSKRYPIEWMLDITFEKGTMSFLAFNYHYKSNLSLDDIFENIQKDIELHYVPMLIINKTKFRLSSISFDKKYLFIPEEKIQEHTSILKVTEGIG